MRVSEEHIFGINGEVTAFRWGERWCRTAHIERRSWHERGVGLGLGGLPIYNITRQTTEVNYPKKKKN